MRLLDPNSVKQEKKREIEANARRVRGLAEEEKRQLQSLNDFREERKREQNRLKEELSAFEKRCEKKKARLLDELAALEVKRNDFLSDLEPKRKELDELIQFHQEALKQVESKEASLATKTEHLETIREDLEKLQKEVEAESQIQKEKSEKLEAVLLEVKQIKQNVFRDRKNVNRALSKTEDLKKGLEIREKQVEVDEETNKNYHQALEKKEEELRNFERRLLSERQAINQAKIHLGL